MQLLAVLVTQLVRVCCVCEGGIQCVQVGGIEKVLDV